MIIRFTIFGNQEDPLRGNPVPYHRATQGSSWSPAHQRYLAWKDHVRSAYYEAARGRPWPRPEGTNLHPIAGDPHGSVNAEIWFGSENHADPDNIVKGILDSIFKNDKHIDVYTHHQCRSKEPRVVVTINLKI